VSGNYETTEGDMSSTEQRAPGAGHRLAEEASKEMLAVLTEFLVPCREGGGALR
jgi:hypothetical protein